MAEAVAVTEPPAAAVPSLPRPEPEASADEQQLVIAFGERRYRVRGWPKQLTEALKVNVLVTCAAVDALGDAETALHVDTFDLYQAKARCAFAKLRSAALEGRSVSRARPALAPSSHSSSLAAASGG